MVSVKFNSAVVKYNVHRKMQYSNKLKEEQRQVMKTWMSNDKSHGITFIVGGSNKDCEQQTFAAHRCIIGACRLIQLLKY